MNVSGTAQFAGLRSGLTKEGKPWGSVVLDNPDNLLERIQVFIREADMIEDCKLIPTGTLVDVGIRLYGAKEGVGSTLMSILPAEGR